MAAEFIPHKSEASAKDIGDSNLIPEGWRQLTLSEIAASKIVYGIVQAGPHVPEGVPYLKSSDIGGKIDVSNLQKTAPEVHARYRRSTVRPGDIVISLRGNTGETSIVPPSLHEANLTQGTARIAVAAEFDSDFIYHQIASSAVQRRIHSATKGSTFVEITLDDLRNVEMLCPSSRCEQRRIAEIVSTWDRAIETVEALVTNARGQKKALMQSLLTGKKRLPGFSEEWRHRRIGELSTKIDRRNDGARVPVLTISSTSGFVRQDQKYSRFMAGKSVESYIMLRRGEFAYNKGNSKTYEFGCVFDLEEFECGLVPHVYVCFKLKDGYSHRFYKALFEADYLAPQLGRLVNTGIRNNGLLNITPAQFLSTSVPVPPLDEQDAIAALMETASAELRALAGQLAALRKEKSALMQQLLTGKRRVKADQKEAA
jgi:type I restriction enzyme S subunit